MKVIAISNQKGGVGKTAIAVNLAHFAAEHGVRVLVVDLDGQGNTSACLSNDQASPGASLLFDNELENQDAIVLDTVSARIKLIRADANLNDAEALPLNSIINVRKHMRSIGGIYDLVIVDTPPAFGRRQSAAMLSADYVLMPFTPDSFAIDGMGKLLKAANAIKAAGNRGMQILGILPNKVNWRSAEQRRVLQELGKQAGRYVLPNMVMERVSISDALGRRMPAWKNPNGESARKAGKEMRAACHDIFARMGVNFEDGAIKESK